MRHKIATYGVETLATPGMVRTIYRSLDSVIVEHTCNGGPAGELRFALGPETQILSNAIDVAISAREGPARRVGLVRVRSGAAIEVGAYAGTVLMRWVLPSGERRRTTMFRGASLDALRRAVEDLHSRQHAVL
jgi:hypothetical protein